MTPFDLSKVPVVLSNRQGQRMALARPIRSARSFCHREVVVSCRKGCVFPSIDGCRARGKVASGRRRAFSGAARRAWQPSPVGWPRAGSSQDQRAGRCNDPRTARRRRAAAGDRRRLRGQPSGALEKGRNVVRPARQRDPAQPIHRET